MSLDPSLEADPNGAGDDAGSQEADRGTQAPQAPAVRTYSDADMASARRSFQAESQREWQRREAAIRSEFEQRFVPREQPKTTDPWAQFDPNVANALRPLFEAELAPFRQWQQQAQQQQEDLALRNDEAELRSRFSDYGKNRAQILEYAVQHNIGDIEQAYRAWKYEELSGFDKDAFKKQVISEYTKRKAAQAAGTPSVEGRGGGTPSGKQSFQGKDGKLDRDAMDRAAEEMFRSANESSA